MPSKKLPAKSGAKKAKGSGLKTYNKVLKVLSAENKKLPDDTRLGMTHLRKLASDSLYPKYKGKNHRTVKVRELKRKIQGILEQIPAREVCDINLIPTSFYGIVDWFAIDEFLQSIMPDCINVRVNAGEYGMTSIFNTRNYSYHKRGVMEIIDNLRELTDDTSQLDFQGVKKLKPGKPNDGTPDHYFIDFVLNINTTPVADTSSVHYKVTKEMQPKGRRVKQIINERMGQLKAEKTRKSRAKKRTQRNIEEIREITDMERKAKSAAKKSAALQVKLRLLNKSRALIDKDYKAKLISKKEYETLIKKLYGNFDKGGEI